ncbi:MAG: dTMP kinase [Methanocellales archaeon]|nr:dTMP kinase [Methanocellales archaeon]
MKGRLITFEGIDGSGKSTLAKRVVRLLRKDYDIFFTKEPTTTWTGDVVRQSIDSDTDSLVELFLFIADHAENVALIKKELSQGKIIISDRYSDSQYAYQGVLLADRFEDPIKWIKEIHDGWNIKPDLTFLLLADPSVSLARCDRQKAKFEEIEFLEKVQKNYLKLADEEPERFIKIDAEKELAEMEKEVMDRITSYLERL